MQETHPLRHRVFRGSRAVKRGLLTRAQLRGRAWHHLFRDVYADRALPDSHRLRCLAASGFLLPPGAAIAGRSAAHLFGVPYLDADSDVEVLSPRPFGPVKGLVIHYGDLEPGDTVRDGRLVVTTALRTAWDLARWLDLPEAMIFLDSLAARGGITQQTMLAYADARALQPGWPRVLRAARLIEPGSEPPQESRLRAHLALAGLPPPVAQHTVTRDGRFIARVDLAWPQFRIAVEYDGLWHGDPTQLERDRARLNALLGAD